MPTEFKLWDSHAPGALGAEDADVPTLTVYSDTPSSKRSACVVCPGGGYVGLAPHEGRPVAEWFDKVGVRGFVLKYRLGPRYHHPRMLEDVERAIRTVRARASEFNIDPTSVGVLGFSAGGHLASTASTHFGPGIPGSPDAIDHVSSRPDWSVLIYPVIDMDGPYAHRGSRENLLGEHPTAQDLRSLSNANAVSLDTPPTFICHGADDTVVPIQNSLGYATALAGHRIPFELYVPEEGAHGFGLGQPDSQTDWTSLCERWLRNRKIIG